MKKLFFFIGIPLYFSLPAKHKRTVIYVWNRRKAYQQKIHSKATIHEEVNARKIGIIIHA